jgi:hypothetical protein
MHKKKARAWALTLLLVQETIFQSEISNEIYGATYDADASHEHEHEV